MTGTERMRGRDGEAGTAGLCLRSRLLEVGVTEYADGFDAGARRGRGRRNQGWFDLWFEPRTGSCSPLSGKAELGRGRGGRGSVLDVLVTSGHSSAASE